MEKNKLSKNPIKIYLIYLRQCLSDKCGGDYSSSILAVMVVVIVSGCWGGYNSIGCNRCCIGSISGHGRHCTGAGSRNNSSSHLWLIKMWVL